MRCKMLVVVSVCLLLVSCVIHKHNSIGYIIDRGERRIDTFQVARSDQALGKLYKPSNIVLKVELLTDMTLLKMEMAMFINLIRRKSFVLSVLCLFPLTKITNFRKSFFLGIWY